MELYIHSDLQTKMLVVLLRRHPELCVKTSFVFATGDNHRVIGLSPIASALGSVKLAALPAFHADITGRFSVKGKLLCWKTFMDTEDTKTALGSLQEPQCISRNEILVLVENFISQLYQPGTGISQDGIHVCSEKNQGNRIGFYQTKGHFMKQFSPPTIKMIVSNNDKVRCPSLLQPDGFDGRKGRINGSPLWQKKHLLLKKSSNCSSAAVKEPMLTQSKPLPEIRLELHLPLFLLWQ